MQDVAGAFAQAFATLSGRDSRAWPAHQFVRGQRVLPFEQDLSLIHISEPTRPY